jgi:pimeloyl-ACP methyl ester carboxylesterase
MNLTVNGVSLHVLDEGDGAPVLLLHGFPDFAALWRHQIPELVRAGHRVIAPDRRGFGASGRPDRVEQYGVATLVADVLGILDTLGVDRADVVGHDWGAAVGWALAGAVPARVTRLAALSVGHPAGYFTDMRGLEALSSSRAILPILAVQAEVVDTGVEPLRLSQPG